MIKEREIANALCTIKGDLGNRYTAKGQGAFIAPGRVLTAWHVVKGTRNVRVIDSLGRESKMLRGPHHQRDVKNDLAVITLQDPDVGSDFLDINFNSTRFKSPLKGTLATRFTGEATFHPVERNGVFPAENGSRLSVYFAFVKSQQGYSGSPILDEKGQIVSVLTATPIARRKRAELDQEAGIRAASGQRPHMPFVAPQPHQFSEFMSRVLLPSRG